MAAAWQIAVVERDRVVDAKAGFHADVETLWVAFPPFRSSVSANRPPIPVSHLDLESSAVEKLVDVSGGYFGHIVLDHYARRVDSGLLDFRPFHARVENWPRVEQTGIFDPSFIFKFFQFSIGISIVEHFTFRFCVDFYEIDGRPRFGEMTFHPMGDVARFDPPEYDAIIGALWR